MLSAAHTGLNVCPVYTGSLEVFPPNSLPGRQERKLLQFRGQKLQDGTEGPGSATPWERSAILSPPVGALSGSWFRDSTSPELDPPRKFVIGKSWAKELAGLVLSSAAAKPDWVPSPWVFQGINEMC